MTLKDVLKSKKITNYQLAKDLGSSYTSIFNVVSGKGKIKNLRLETGYKLAERLNMSVKDLLELEESRKVNI